jgi:hypothetical protein
MGEVYKGMDRRGEGASGVLHRNVKRNRYVPGIEKGDGIRTQGGQIEDLTWILNCHVMSPPPSS